MPFPAQRRYRDRPPLYYDTRKKKRQAPAGPPPQNWNSFQSQTNNQINQETKLRKLNSGGVSRLHPNQQHPPQNFGVQPGGYNQATNPNQVSSQPHHNMSSYNAPYQANSGAPPVPPKTDHYVQPLPPAADTFRQPPPPAEDTFRQPPPPAADTFHQPPPPAAGAFRQPPPPASDTFRQPPPPAPDSFAQPAPPKPDSFHQPPHGNRFKQERHPPQRNSFNHPPQGNSFNHPPQGNSFNHQGNSFNHQPQRDSFNHPPQGNSSNHPPQGNSFNQPQGNSLHSQPQTNGYNRQNKENSSNPPLQTNSFNPPPNASSFNRSHNSKAFNTPLNANPTREGNSFNPAVNKQSKQNSSYHPTPKAVNDYNDSRFNRFKKPHVQTKPLTPKKDHHIVSGGPQIRQTNPQLAGPGKAKPSKSSSKFKPSKERTNANTNTKSKPSNVQKPQSWIPVESGVIDLTDGPSNSVKKVEKKKQQPQKSPQPKPKEKKPSGPEAAVAPPPPPPGKPPLTDLMSRKAAMAKKPFTKKPNQSVKAKTNVKRTQRLPCTTQTKATPMQPQSTAQSKPAKQVPNPAPSPKPVTAAPAKPTTVQPRARKPISALPPRACKPMNAQLPKAQAAQRINSVKAVKQQLKPFPKAKSVKAAKQQRKPFPKPRSKPKGETVDLTEDVPKVPPGLQSKIKPATYAKFGRHKLKQKGSPTGFRPKGNFRRPPVDIRDIRDVRRDRWFENQPYYEEDRWFEEPFYGGRRERDYKSSYRPEVDYEKQYKEPYEKEYTAPTWGKTDEDFEIDYEKEAVKKFKDDYYEASWHDSKVATDSLPAPAAVPVQAPASAPIPVALPVPAPVPVPAPTPVTVPQRSPTPENIVRPTANNQKRPQFEHTNKRIRRIRKRNKTPPVVRAPAHLELQEKIPFKNGSEQRKFLERQELKEMCHRLDMFIDEKFGPGKISQNRPKPTIENPHCYVVKITETNQEEILTDFLSEFINNDLLLAIWGRGNVKPSNGHVRNYVVTLKFKESITDFVEAAADVGLMVHLMNLQKWLQIEANKNKQVAEIIEDRSVRRVPESPDWLRERSRERSRGSKRSEQIESYPSRSSNRKRKKASSTKDVEIIEIDVSPERNPSVENEPIIKKIEAAASPSPPAILKKTECEDDPSASPQPPIILNKFERSPSPEKTQFSPLNTPPPPPIEPPLSPLASGRRRRSRSRQRKERSPGKHGGHRERSRRFHKHPLARGHSPKRTRFRSKSPKKKSLSRFSPMKTGGVPQKFSPIRSTSTSAKKKKKKDSEKRKKSAKKHRSTSPLALGFRAWDKRKRPKSRSGDRSRSRNRKRKRSLSLSRKSRSRERSRKKKKKKDKSKHSLRDSKSASPEKTTLDGLASNDGPVIDLTDDPGLPKPSATLYDPALASTTPTAGPPLQPLQDQAPIDPTKAGFMPVSTQPPVPISTQAPMQAYYNPNAVGYYNAAYQQPPAYQTMPQEQHRLPPQNFDMLQATNANYPVSAITTEERDELLDLLPDLDIDFDEDDGGGANNHVLRKITELKEKQDARRKTLLAQMAKKLDTFRSVREHEMPKSMFRQFYLKVCGSAKACDEYHKACQEFRQEQHIRED